MTQGFVSKRTNGLVSIGSLITGAISQATKTEQPKKREFDPEAKEAVMSESKCYFCGSHSVKTYIQKNGMTLIFQTILDDCCDERAKQVIAGMDASVTKLHRIEKEKQAEFDAATFARANAAKLPDEKAAILSRKYRMAQGTREEILELDAVASELVKRTARHLIPKAATVKLMALSATDAPTA
jgi:hypothetical protein